MEQRILQLKKEMSELLEWKKRFEIQQVEKPFGSDSKAIIHRDLLVSNGVFGSTTTPDTFLEVIVDGKKWWLEAQSI